MKIVFRKGTSIRLYPAVFCSLPASTVPDNFKFDTKSEDSTFSATINSFPAVLLKTGIYIRFRTAVQATAPCQSIKVLSLFLSVEFEIIDACTGWKRAGREQKAAGYCRVDAPSGNEECGTSLTLKRMLEKQKTWRQALNLQQNCLSGTRVFCCKFCF
ncbi:MAG TPA: hypothetical protein H9748_00115 [Candidatus Mediterraneibacter norwichensis]|nr:hypothetical protein [Candidatus Mediterraneibacter norwichensis]